MGRFTPVKTFSDDQNSAKKMSIVVHDKQLKSQVSKLETINAPFLHATKEL